MYARATQTSIDGVLTLMGEYRIAPEEIQGIHITLREIGRMITEPRAVKYRPQSAAIAKFSLPFVVGTAAIYGGVGLDSFTDERLPTRPCWLWGTGLSTRSIPTGPRSRISIPTSPSAPPGGFSLHLEHPLSCVEHPMGEGELRRKFFDCAARARRPYGPETLEDRYDAMLRLEELEDVRQRFDLL